VSLAAALLVPALAEWTFRSQLVLEVDLTAKGATYESFTKSDDAVRYSIYYFDLTNEEAVVAEGEKPVLSQRGPYSYDEKFEMFDIEFKGSRMKFLERKFYVFNPEKSCPGCNDTADVVTTVDLVTIELLEAAKGDTLLTAALSKVLCDTRGDSDRVSPFVRKTIHEAHWGAWGDPTLAAATMLLKAFNATQKRASLLGSYVPGFETNHTSREGVRRSFGGRDEVRTKNGKSMRYEKYQNSRYVRVCLAPSLPGDDANKVTPACPQQDPAWDDDSEEGESLAQEAGWFLSYGTRKASRVKGASPTFVKPLELNHGRFGRGLFYASPHRFHKFAKGVFFAADKTYRGAQSLHVFIDSVYRELKFERTLKDGHVTRRGLSLERYQLDRSAFGIDPDYDQFTTPYGVLNLTRPAGVPLVASQPHFFDSAPALQEAVWGLAPSRALHNTYLDVEPRSGQVFAALQRLQFNAYLFDYGVRSCNGVAAAWPLFPARVSRGSVNQDGFIFPIGYIDQGYEVSEKDAAALRQDLKLVDFLSDAGFLVFLFFALVFFARGTYLLLFFWESSDQEGASSSSLGGAKSSSFFGGGSSDDVVDYTLLEEEDQSSVQSHHQSFWSSLFSARSKRRRAAAELPPQTDGASPLISI